MGGEPSGLPGSPVRGGLQPCELAADGGRVTGRHAVFGAGIGSEFRELCAANPAGRNRGKLFELSSRRLLP